MKNPKTVIVVNDFAHINGGAGQVAHSSARELARRGHAVILFCAVGPVDESLADAGVRVVCTGQPEILRNPNRLSAAVQGIWNRRAAGEMRRLLSSLDPARTIIHIHGWTKALSSSIMPVAFGHGAGVVVTVHDYFLTCPNGGFYNYGAGKICHLEPLSLACLATNCDSRSYSQKLWRITRQLVQELHGHLPEAMGHFIMISPFSKRVMAPFLPVGAKTYDIENPVEAKFGDPVQASQNQVFVYVGRLSEEKGPLLAAEAARRAACVLKIVGDGCVRQRIEAQYPEFEITGWASRDEVDRQLRSARALVFPSSWYETQGLVVLEAAARGIPSVVADTSAARENVADGTSGLWFRGGDVDDLARKLDMLRDDTLVRRLGRVAFHRFWADPPTLAKHVDRLEDCYRSVLESRPAGEPALLPPPPAHDFSERIKWA